MKGEKMALNNSPNTGNTRQNTRPNVVPHPMQNSNIKPRLSKTPSRPLTNEERRQEQERFEAYQNHRRNQVNTRDNQTTPSNNPHNNSEVRQPIPRVVPHPMQNSNIKPRLSNTPSRPLTNEEKIRGQQKSQVYQNYRQKQMSEHNNQGNTSVQTMNKGKAPENQNHQDRAEREFRDNINKIIKAVGLTPNNTYQPISDKQNRKPQKEKVNNHHSASSSSNLNQNNTYRKH